MSPEIKKIAIYAGLLLGSCFFAAYTNGLLDPAIVEELFAPPPPPPPSPVAAPPAPSSSPLPPSASKVVPVDAAQKRYQEMALVMQHSRWGIDPFFSTHIEKDLFAEPGRALATASSSSPLLTDTTQASETPPPATSSKTGQDLPSFEEIADQIGEQIGSVENWFQDELNTLEGAILDKEPAPEEEEPQPTPFRLGLAFFNGEHWVAAIFEEEELHVVQEQDTLGGETVTHIDSTHLILRSKLWGERKLPLAEAPESITLEIENWTVEYEKGEPLKWSPPASVKINLLKKRKKSP